MSTHKLKRQILETLRVPHNHLSRKEILPDVPKYEAIKSINELIDEGLVELDYEAIDDNQVIELTDKGYYVLNNYNKHVFTTCFKRVAAIAWTIIIASITIGLLLLLFKLLFS